MPTRKFVQGILALLFVLSIVLTWAGVVSAQEDVWLENPVEGSYISSEFGWREMGGNVNFHHGRDFAAPLGTPIVSVTNGYIVLSDWWPESSRTNQGTGLGLTVAVYEPSSGLYIYYGHMSRFEFPNLTEAVPVRKGDVIGYVGSTGWSTGPHTHLGISRNGPEIQNCWSSEGCWYDPRNYLGSAPAGPVDPDVRPILAQGIVAPLFEPLVDEAPQHPVPIVEYQKLQATKSATQPKAAQVGPSSNTDGLTQTGKYILFGIAGLGLLLVFFGYGGQSKGAMLLGLLILVGVVIAFVGLTSDTPPTTDKIL